MVLRALADIDRSFLGAQVLADGALSPAFFLYVLVCSQAASGRNDRAGLRFTSVPDCDWAIPAILLVTADNQHMSLQDAVSRWHDLRKFPSVSCKQFGHSRRRGAEVPHPPRKETAMPERRDGQQTPAPEPLFIGSEIYRGSSYGAGHPLRVPRVSTVMDLARALG